MDNINERIRHMLMVRQEMMVLEYEYKHGPTEDKKLELETKRAEYNLLRAKYDFLVLPNRAELRNKLKLN